MCRNMKFILSVDQDISRVSEANEWDFLITTRNKFYISKHPCIVLFIIDKKMPYYLAKIALNHNVHAHFLRRISVAIQTIDNETNYL